MKDKEKRFLIALQSAKKALESIDASFHLHSGTSLRAHREKTFAIFYINRLKT